MCLLHFVVLSFVTFAIIAHRVHSYMCVCNNDFDNLIIHNKPNFSRERQENRSDNINLLGVAKEGECVFYNGTEVIEKKTFWKTDIKGKRGWIALGEHNGLQMKNCSDPIRDVKEGSNCLHLMKITHIYREPRKSKDAFHNIMVINACNTLTDCPNLISKEPFQMNNNSWYNVTYSNGKAGNMEFYNLSDFLIPFGYASGNKKIRKLLGFIVADDEIRWHCKDTKRHEILLKEEVLQLWEIVIVMMVLILFLAVPMIVRIVHERQKSHQERKTLYNQYQDSDDKSSRTEYDVFVSYSRDDLDWVRKELFKRLQDEGINVCIDFKDFIPGMDVSENILTGIYASRKTIVIMSQNFLKSVWGQFELHHAHYKAIIKRRETLILIKYDKCKVPRKLMGKTFLDWTCYKERPYFWKRLFQSISIEKQRNGESFP